MLIPALGTKGGDVLDVLANWPHRTMRPIRHHAARGPHRPEGIVALRATVTSMSSSAGKRRRARRLQKASS